MKVPKKDERKAETRGDLTFGRRKSCLVRCMFILLLSCWNFPAHMAENTYNSSRKPVYHWPESEDRVWDSQRCWKLKGGDPGNKEATKGGTPKICI